MTCTRFSERTKEGKHQDQTVCHQPALKPVLTSWPHLHKDLQQITGAVRSPLVLQMLHHHPRPKETQHYWTYWLQTRGSNVCGHEIIWKTGLGLSEGHHWTLTGPSAVWMQNTQQSKQVCEWYSQHGTALHPSSSGQKRDLCEDTVCGLQLRF